MGGCAGVSAKKKENTSIQRETGNSWNAPPPVDLLVSIENLLDGKGKIGKLLLAPQKA